MLKGKRIVIGITGSIAAYKIPLLIRLLIKEGAEIKVIMTPIARDFVTPLTLATLSSNPVMVDPFDPGNGSWNNHVELGQWADLMLFAPVTANSLGKMANGIADNFVITAYLSAKCPVFIAPAMDMDMYQHPSTQKNIAQLRSYGNTIIEPQVGELASGLSGPGRLEEPEIILHLIQSYFKKDKSLSKKKILITAGPTYEKIDPVRFIGNYSSGRMGFALAEEAALRGGKVLLITGPTNLSVNHPSISRINVESADEMHQACLGESTSADIIIMAAAVADFKVKEPQSRKIKKENKPLHLDLLPTPDILYQLGQQKRKHQIIVGFALETNNEIQNARKKLRTKKLDFIILNAANVKGEGFNGPTNRITIIDKKGNVIHGVLKSKKNVASDIFDVICSQKQNINSD